MAPQKKREATGHKTPSAGQSRQVPAQRGADRATHQDAGAFRAPTNAARSFNQHRDVRLQGRETLLKLALPAPRGSGNAAGRLTRHGRPAADDFPGHP